jgi:hypothetical protein
LAFYLCKPMRKFCILHPAIFVNGEKGDKLICEKFIPKYNRFMFADKPENSIYK